MESKFRGLPSVDKLMSGETLKQLLTVYPHELIVSMARRELDEVRASIAQGNPCPSNAEIACAIDIKLSSLVSPSPHPVINATGVILHTNLGRAPLSGEAIAAMAEASKGYCDLEFVLSDGTRGSRHTRIEKLLCQLTGAEAAMVVNNNASAVLLALTALARRKEVIVSRGQSVEIGGGFRIPEVMRQSGAKLVEVGTTNATYTSDFEQAVTPRTAALLRVHSSNFKLVGFTSGVTIEELVELGEKHGLPVIDDLGSGSLLDTTSFGLDPEPTVQHSVATGVAVSCFSGDKLIGGPQAGIIVGKKQFVDKLKKHPLARAVRIDKVRLAGLTATLIPYLTDEAIETIPVWRMISAPLDELEKRAARWAGALDDLARVEEGESMVGGGSLPGGTLPTRLAAVGKHRRKGERNRAQELAKLLRTHETPLVGRLSGNILFLDPRSVLPEEDEIVIDVLRTSASGL